MSRDSTVMVLAKGFRVTEDTEEFQLVWPPNQEHLTFDVERSLTHAPWPEVLRGLYKMSSDEVLSLRCVLLSKHSTTAVSVAHTRDRHRRPSIVAVAVTQPIEWSTPMVSPTVARCQSAAKLLAEELATQFTGSPRQVAQHLRHGGLPEGLPEMYPPRPEEMYFWESAIASARKWKGIAGLASPQLFPLGANIIIGTRHEAIRSLGVNSTDADGFFDELSGEILPFPGRLVRWPNTWEPEQSNVALQPKTHEDAEAESLAEIEKSLKGIDRSLGILANATVDLLELAAGLWLGGKPRKK